MKKVIALLLTLMLCSSVGLTPQFDYPANLTPVDHPQPLWAGVNWNNSDEVVNYVHNAYGKLGQFMVDLIRRESSFNPEARNGNFVGLVQIGPAACRSVNIAYNDAILYPWLNIEAGARYVQQYCIPMSRGHGSDEVYKRYNLGPWYDSVPPPDSL